MIKYFYSVVWTTSTRIGGIQDHTKCTRELNMEVNKNMLEFCSLTPTALKVFMTTEKSLVVLQAEGNTMCAWSLKT